MRIIERLKDAYYIERDRRLLKQMEDNDSFFIQSGEVTERQIKYLALTPKFQSLYRELNEAYQDPDRAGEANERLRTLSSPQYVLVNRLWAEELRSKLDL